MMVLGGVMPRSPVRMMPRRSVSMVTRFHRLEGRVRGIGHGKGCSEQTDQEHSQDFSH